MLSRRRFLSLSAGLVSAPAIVRVASLMPVKTPAFIVPDAVDLQAAMDLGTFGSVTVEMFFEPNSDGGMIVKRIIERPPLDIAKIASKLYGG